MREPSRPIALDHKAEADDPVESGTVTAWDLGRGPDDSEEVDVWKQCAYQFQNGLGWGVNPANGSRGVNGNRAEGVGERFEVAVVAGIGVETIPIGCWD